MFIVEVDDSFFNECFDAINILNHELMIGSVIEQVDIEHKNMFGEVMADFLDIIEL